MVCFGTFALICHACQAKLPGQDNLHNSYPLTMIVVGDYFDSLGEVVSTRSGNGK